MASDAGPQAPAEATTPAGVDGVKTVTVRDPLTGQSSYSNYGNAARGIVCDAAGNVLLDPETGKPALERRRPRDFATITTATATATTAAG